MIIKVNAYAKINLMLDILNKRTDAYHELFMIMQSVDVHDTVTVSSSDKKGITLTCDKEGIPLDATNIAWKAAADFYRYTGIKNKGITIDIKKKIPHAAGLAGGSADGAAVLVALNRFYNAGLSDDELCKIGVVIGADVPFCIVGGTELCQGIGEIMHPLKPLRQCSILLAKPTIGVNTGKAYAKFDNGGKTHQPDCLSMLKAIQSRDLIQISKRCENVFEQFIEVPGRVDIKEIMRKNGALGVCMSGSGPTVYGIFDTVEKAQSAAAGLIDYAADIIVTKPVSKGCKIVTVKE